LIDSGGGETADLSRDHAVLENDSGLFSIVGGKLTEYRLMAEDVLDRAVSARGLQPGPCRTKDLPLVGAPGKGVAAPGFSGRLPASLVARYGSEAPAVLASAQCARPDEPVAEGIDVTRAEFEFAVTHEGALDAGDILDRRTRIGLVAADRERSLDAAQEALA
jgi:glycerol-3-phosphate dehydrogenase